MVFLTQLVFYGLPWLEWGQRQMVLFDLGARRFYIFGLVLYPQDFIYLTGLLIISALSLFLFTAVAGRLWCGYACPQTVYTEIFMWVERKLEGDRAQRMKLDRSPMSASKLARKGAKHFLWVAVALWTGPLPHDPPAVPFGRDLPCIAERLPPHRMVRGHLKRFDQTAKLFPARRALRRRIGHPKRLVVHMRRHPQPLRQRDLGTLMQLVDEVVVR